MTYRLAGTAEEQIEQILSDSARRFGIDAASRYHRLILAGMAAVATDPVRGGSRPIRRVPGVRAFPLDLARQRVEGMRVGRPRHLLLYRIGADSVVEILGLVHDRMILPRAARRADREADR